MLSLAKPKKLDPRIASDKTLKMLERNRYRRFSETPITFPHHARPYER
jgi:hypothetical protein